MPFYNESHFQVRYMIETVEWKYTKGKNIQYVNTSGDK